MAIEKAMASHSTAYERAREGMANIPVGYKQVDPRTWAKHNPDPVMKMHLSRAAKDVKKAQPKPAQKLRPQRDRDRMGDIGTSYGPAPTSGGAWGDISDNSSNPMF
jgi:hypothetical protein